MSKGDRVRVIRREFATYGGQRGTVDGFTDAGYPLVMLDCFRNYTKKAATRFRLDELMPLAPEDELPIPQGATG